jgi:hypothetical protein
MCHKYKFIYTFFRGDYENVTFDPNRAVYRRFCNKVKDGP